MSAILTRIYNGARDRIRTVTNLPIAMGPARNPPDRVVIVHPGVLLDDVSDEADTLLFLQIRVRVGQNDSNAEALDIQQAIFDALHLQESLDFDGISVALTWRQASAEVAFDANSRPEITDTYHLRGIATVV